jgi:hypothetical protein
MEKYIFNAISNDVSKNDESREENINNNRG